MEFNIKELLDGYKVYIGGAGAILVCVGHFMYDWYLGDFQSIDFYLWWLIAGWTIIGGRSAAEKIRKELLSKDGD